MKAVHLKMARLSMHCFYDFAPGGSLCHIFSVMFRYKAEHGWRNVDFKTDTALLLQMMADTEKALIEAKLFRLPVVYFRPGFSLYFRNKMTDILKKRGASITNDERQATHIVYEHRFRKEVRQLASPVMRRGKNILLHLHYSAPSRDRWIPDTSNFLVNMKYMLLILLSLCNKYLFWF